MINLLILLYHFFKICHKKTWKSQALVGIPAECPPKADLPLARHPRAGIQFVAFFWIPACHIVNDSKSEGYYWVLI